MYKKPFQHHPERLSQFPAPKTLREAPLREKCPLHPGSRQQSSPTMPFYLCAGGMVVPSGAETLPSKSDIADKILQLT